MRTRLMTIVFFSIIVLSACDFSLAEDITPPPNYVAPMPAPTLGPLFPAVAPSPSGGRSIYVANCGDCHGEKGLGNGPQAADIPVPVAAIGLADIARQSSPASWFTVVSQGRMDRYMPGFTSLTDQQRWDVLAFVYSLSTAPEMVQRGASLYGGVCVQCHGANGNSQPTANFTNQEFMAQMTGIGLYRAIAEGVPSSMPAFGGELSEPDIWALTTFLRTLTFDMTEPTATLQPTEASTLSMATATFSGAEATPALSTSEAGGSTGVPVTPGAATGTVRGMVVRAAGGSLPTGLTVTLRGYDHFQDGSGNISEVVNLTAPLNADGSYSFVNVEMPANRVFYAEVLDQGVTFQSNFATVTEGTALLTLASLTIYEPTNDLSALTLVQVHIIADFSTENVVQIYEIYVFTNPGQQVILVPMQGSSISFIALPEDAQNINFDLASGSASLISAEGGFAVLPSDNQYGIVASFSLPYEKKLEVVQPFVLAPVSVNLLVPEGVTLKGKGLSDTGVQTIQSGNYQTYSAANIKAGSTLTFTITGKPISYSSTASTTTGFTTQTSLAFGLGGLGVVLILAGVYFFFRDRARRAELDEEEPEEGEERAEDSLGDDVEQLTDAIIALDDQFKAGAIAKEAYENRRAELKRRLKELL